MMMCCPDTLLFHLSSLNQFELLLYSSSSSSSYLLLLQKVMSHNNNEIQKQKYK